MQLPTEAEPATRNAASVCVCGRASVPEILAVPLIMHYVGIALSSDTDLHLLLGVTQYCITSASSLHLPCSFSFLHKLSSEAADGLFHRCRRCLRVLFFFFFFFGDTGFRVVVWSQCCSPVASGVGHPSTGAAANPTNSKSLQ